MSRLARGIPAATRIQGSPSPLAVGICLIGAMLALAAAPAARATTFVGGIEFEDNAFADFVYDWVGGWAGVGGPGALIGDETADYGSCYGSECQVTVEFYDNIMLNLEGPDLAVFQLGWEDTFAVRIAGVTNLYDALDMVDTGFDVTVYMGEELGDVIFDLIVAQIDLDDFPVEPGGAVTIVDLFSDPLDTHATPADFTVIASMNIVPEPSTVLLLAMGLVGLAMNGRRPRA